MLQQEFKVTVTVLASSQAEADRKGKALSTAGSNITADNLDSLAKAAQKKGVNDKIKNASRLGLL